MKTFARYALTAALGTAAVVGPVAGTAAAAAPSGTVIFYIFRTDSTGTQFGQVGTVDTARQGLNRCHNISSTVTRYGDLVNNGSNRTFQIQSVPCGNYTGRVYQIPATTSRTVPFRVYAYEVK